MKSLKLLGQKGKDKITGASGIITSICYDLYGCIQVTLDAGLDKDGKRIENFWIDINRIEIIDKKYIMKPPTFNEKDNVLNHKKGPANKPVR